MVDIRGSQRHVSVHLAEKFPNLHFIVQDRPKVIEGAEVKIPDDLEDRIRIMAHDMFTEQPVVGAGVYLFQYVLHDWSDKYPVQDSNNLSRR